MKFTDVFYFDFEASTDGDKHLPYCLCFQSADGTIKRKFYGRFCARKFLDAIPDKSLCYAHNLSYDFAFIVDLLNGIYDNSIIKNGKVYQIEGCYQGKRLLFKDSYCIISAPLKLFPSMFNLDSGRKECFPYGYYSSERSTHEIGNINDALEFIDPSDHELFKKNVREIASVPSCAAHPSGRAADSALSFSMKHYAWFYCMQDVTILRQGMEWFRESLSTEFGLDVYKFVSISSIANRLMERECYWKNDNLFDLANTPREFISRCIQGGRCMLADNAARSLGRAADNQPVKVDRSAIVDFDAVSLYPSAIRRLYTLEGVPQVLSSEMLTQKYLLEHLFKDNQLEPTNERFISGFFIEAKITHVGIKRHFPLLVWEDCWNGGVEHDRSTNDPCTMYIDHITFEDLIRYQDATIVPVRGYYYSGKRDPLCEEVIQRLFDLRLRYKKEGNPLQTIIKLLLNSVYGKTILKPIDTQLKFISLSQKERYICNRYHYIKELTGYANMKRFMSVEYKPYHKHFSFAPFGVNILSMSKRIMNEVMCTAEDLGIDIFYQDTDSMHLYRDDLPKLVDEYRKRYNRELIGTGLGQFHTDLEPVNGLDSIATRSIFIMKKVYIDQLENINGDIAFHVRMKGISTDVIVNKANKLFDGTKCTISSSGLVYPESCKGPFTIMQLYEAIYDGAVIEFDLVKDGTRPCFDVKIGEIKTKESFVRRVGLNVKNSSAARSNE